MVAELQCRAQLQAQVLHNHVALQQQEGIAVNLVLSEELHMRPQGLRVSVFHKPDHILHGPGGWVPAPWPPGVLPVWRRARGTSVSFQRGPISLGAGAWGPQPRC